MSEIVIEEGKNVVFNNLMQRRINSADEAGIQKASAMFDQYLQRKRLEPYGPIIICENVRVVNNMSVQDHEMMIQTKEAPAAVDDPYRFMPRMRLEGCLIAKYAGPVNKMFYAHYKIQAYAFEHDLGLGSSTYTVYKSKPDSGFQADIIIQVI